MSDQVTLTREEYEQLRASQPAMVTITAAEYAELKAAASRAAGVDQAMHDRCMARMRELEGLLRREQVEHDKEIATMTATLRKFTGGM